MNPYEAMVQGWRDNYADIAVDPKTLKVGDLIVYGGNNRWRIMAKLDNRTLTCGCAHEYWIAKASGGSEVQVFSFGESDFWLNVVTARNWRKKRARMVAMNEAVRKRMEDARK